MGRKCRGYDRGGNSGDRKDIIIQDLTTTPIESGFDEKLLGKADFIFLDPPYHDMVFETGKIEDFYQFLHILAKKSKLTLKTGGKVGILISDMTEKGQYCLSGESYKIFLEEGLKYIDHISAPMDPNVEFKPREDDERKLIGRNRDLYIFEKEAE